MDWLIEDIAKHGPATTPAEAQQRPVPDFEGIAIAELRDITRVYAALSLFGIGPEHLRDEIGAERAWMSVARQH